MIDVTATISYGFADNVNKTEIVIICKGKRMVIIKLINTQKTNLRF